MDNWDNKHLTGLLPQIITSADPRPVREQIADRYAHGGGYKPFTGFTFNPKNSTINYEGDPPMKALASVIIRDELVVLFENSWVMIMQADGNYAIVRMD